MIIHIISIHDVWCVSYSVSVGVCTVVSDPNPVFGIEFPFPVIAVKGVLSRGKSILRTAAINEVVSVEVVASSSIGEANGRCEYVSNKRVVAVGNTEVYADGTVGYFVPSKVQSQN